MQYELRISGTLDELQAVAAAIAGARTAPAAPEPSPAAPEPSPAAPEPAPASLDAVRAAVKRLFEARGAKAAQGLLAEFGASRAGDIAAERYQAVLDRAAVLMGAK